MRGLGLVGAIALLFGLIPTSVTGELGVFAAVNLAIGALALLAAAARGVARVRGASEPAFRRALLRGGAVVALTLASAVALERAADRSGLRLDWSSEGSFEPSPAVLGALRDLGRVEASLYVDPLDPRARSSRLLLRTLATTGHLRFDERRLDEHPDEEECFGIESSNTVVVRLPGPASRCGSRFETVDRPTEGTLYEALYRLRRLEGRVLYATRGAGEGDLRATGGAGFSGLATALQTEGYRVRELVLAATPEVPADADVVLVLAPRRPLGADALAALDRHLAGGGRLVAFLELDAASGLEALLARWGMRSPDLVLVDPASARIEGEPPGTTPLAFHYAPGHAVTRGLGPNTMTFFRGARSFELSKPGSEDRLEPLVFASERSWLAPSAEALDGDPHPPAGVVPDYHALAVTGRYPRGGREARIVAFGDADLASNRYLRSLYNLDLVLNAVHWAAQREPEITLRPKARVSGGLQFALPVENTLTMFQGLGLLLPELLLLGGALVWLRSRAG
jgi:hypothetical protein